MRCFNFLLTHVFLFAPVNLFSGPFFVVLEWLYEVLLVSSCYRWRGNHRALVAWKTLTIKVLDLSPSLLSLVCVHDSVIFWSWEIFRFKAKTAHAWIQNSFLVQESRAKIKEIIYNINLNPKLRLHCMRLVRPLPNCVAMEILFVLRWDLEISKIHV